MVIYAIFLASAASPSTRPLLLIRPGLVVFSTKLQCPSLPRSLEILGVKKRWLEKTGAPTLELTADDAQTNRFIITDRYKKVPTLDLAKILAVFFLPS